MDKRLTVRTIATCKKERTTDLTNEAWSVWQRKRLSEHFLELKENSYYKEMIPRCDYRPSDENNGNPVGLRMVIVHILIDVEIYS